LINTDFSNAQEELFTVPSRIHTEQSLRTFSSWGDTQIYNTIRDSFVYNLDLRKIKVDEIIEKPYIVDNTENFVSLPGTFTDIRFLHRLFSDNTIKALTESGWETIYHIGTKIRKYYIRNTYEQGGLISIIITLNEKSGLYIEDNPTYEGNLSAHLDNVSNFWAGFIQGISSFYIFVLKESLLYCYQNYPQEVCKFSGCNRSAEQHVQYSFIPVYQHPSNIKSMLTGSKHAAIITEYSIVEPYFDGTTSIFNTEHVFTSAIKDSCLVDTFGSSLASSASWYVLLENGELWTKGDNTYGQLGLNSADAYIADWTKVDHLFDQISVGYYVIYANISSGLSIRQNTFVYGVDKETSYVYAWGSSTHNYPLGIDSTSKVTVPTLILSVPIIKVQSTKMSASGGITPTAFWDNYISAGGLFLDRSGSCYIAGNACWPALGDYGGANNISANDKKTVRKVPVNERIKDIYIQSNLDYRTTYPYYSRSQITPLLIAESGNLYSLNSLTQYYFNRVL
jgi:alpha-tubulin suppressor-like RCC1 family protein